MRLDKFLKNARLIKRRPLAKQIADQGRIKLNGNVAKAATTVSPNDELEIQYGQRIVTVKVLEIKEHVTKEAATDLYQIVKEEKINQA
ncbi:RNA-binding S4 domain-containing protein [Virgibacillus sp. W0430]|uniref:RNA-binding S4 domain-containing protein n=1 Tax=Virgibacillus sp. W0430 TaxID=3391580 RepID=UPI003F45A66E